VSPDDIKNLRKELACTASELARALKIEARTVVLWETGELFPTKRYVEQMQKLKARGPDAIPRSPKGRASSPAGLPKLSDPKLWEIVRKLAAHPELFDRVSELAQTYDDPGVEA